MALKRVFLILVLSSSIALSQRQGGGKPGKPTTPTQPPPAIPSPTIGSGSDCERHRKAWHELTSHEINLYINGFKELYSRGIMAKFTEQHSESDASWQAHSTAAFLPWHRYFLWELETQFRSLGDEYDCYALPYWDWTYETTHTNDISSFHILNSGLGGVGNEYNEYCVEGGAFGQGEYTPFHCELNSGECCLTRGDCQADPDEVCIFMTPAEQMNIITANDIYGTDETRNTNNGFRYALEFDGHGAAHVQIGHFGHLYDVLYSPDDPIFYLLHTFVDYQYALWQDCKDYDKIPSVLIDNLDVYGGTLGEPGRFSVRGPSEIDFDLIYTVLAAEPWTHLYQTGNTYTPRDLHSISDWGYSYEKGSFWEDAEVDTFCPPQIINDFWFYKEEETTNRRLLHSDSHSQTVIDNELQTPLKRMEKDSLLLLKENNNWNNLNVIKKKQISSTWSRMSCEFNHLALSKPCLRPRYFDDCSDLAINPETQDIEITLDELLAKVTMSQCMTSIRKQFYLWAKQTATLLSLCRGDYDKFCDKSYLHGDEQHQCLAQISKLLNKNEENQEIMNENKRNNKNRIVKKWTSSAQQQQLNPVPQQQPPQQQSSSLTQVQEILLSAVLNGLVIVIIISMAAILRSFYLFCFFTKIGDDNNNKFDDFESDQTSTDKEDIDQ